MTAPDQQQESLDGMNATRVKFVGMSADRLDELPEIGDVITFLVTTRCTGRGEEEMRDGERRPYARMDVQSLDQQGKPKKPSAAPNLFALGDDDQGDD